MDGIALKVVTFRNPAPSFVFGDPPGHERKQDKSYNAKWVTGDERPKNGLAITLFRDIGAVCLERVSKDHCRIERAWTTMEAVETFRPWKPVQRDASILEATATIPPEEKSGARKGGDSKPSR